MKLSTLVRQAGQKRRSFQQVVRAVEAARPLADEEAKQASLAEQHDLTRRFNADKQADREAHFGDVKHDFRAARQHLNAQAGAFRQNLHAATRQLRDASQHRVLAYRTAYREGRKALDDGLDQATALYQEFAPYLRNRHRLRSYWARMPVFERTTWILLHTLTVLAAMLKLAQMPSWSAFLQDDLLLIWGGLWLASLLRWGTAWGLSRHFHRRDARLFEALRKKYTAADLARKQEALARCLPPLALDLSVLAAPTPPDEAAPEEDRRAT